jgi:hypothetical protein
MPPFRCPVMVVSSPFFPVENLPLPTTPSIGCTTNTCTNSKAGGRRYGHGAFLKQQQARAGFSPIVGGRQPCCCRSMHGGHPLSLSQSLRMLCWVLLVSNSTFIMSLSAHPHPHLLTSYTPRTATESTLRPTTSPLSKPYVCPSSRPPSSSPPS